LPFVQALREGGDDGRPIVAIDPDSESGLIFHDIARKIAADNKPRKKFSKFLKINS
jgi:ATP-binding protein involved in chromosome partitioning